MEKNVKYNKEMYNKYGKKYAASMLREDFTITT